MKKLILTFAWLLALFAVHAADFNDGFFYYNIIDEDAKTAEVAPKPDGTYYFPNSYKGIEASVNGYTIVAIGENAFKDASGSFSGNYPMVWSYPPEIKANAFDNCHINFFGLQDPVTTVHPESFKNNKLGYIRCNSSSFTNKVSGTELGALWTPDNSRLIAVPGEWRQGFSSTAASRTNYTLPAATKTIGAYAFYGNTVLNTLDLSSVQVIESQALAGMTALRTLTIPATATTIAADAFAGTTGITTLNVNLTEPVAGVVFDDAVYTALRDKVNFGANANVAAFQADPNWGKFFTKAADDVYILGEVNFNSWSPSNGVQMAYDQNNDVYRATVYTAGATSGYSYFSFTKALGDNWDAIAGSRIGAAQDGYEVTDALLGQPMTLQNGTNAFKIPEGKWELVFSLTNMTLTVNEVTRNVWVLGDVNNNSWAANAGLPMTYDAQAGTYTVTFKAKGQNDGYSFFNFTTELAAAADGWNDIANYRIGAVSNGDFLVTEQWLDQELSLTHGTNAFKIPAGNYTLTLDLKNYKLTISVAPFDATPFKSGAYYFRPISDTEVEFIHPSEYDATLGPYSGITDTSAPGTVTNNDVTYTVTTVGAGAFKDATITGSMETVRMIWFDAATTTVKADAFNNWTINAVGLRATDIDPTAFRNNHINRFNSNSQNVFYVSSDNSGNHGAAMTGDLYKLVDGKKILWAWGGDRKVGLWTSENQTFTTSYTFSAYDEIGDYALYGNQRLQEVTIQNATKIGKESMAYMTALRTLTLPAELTEIGQDAFKGVTTITSLTVNAATPPAGGVFENDVYEACKDRLVVPEGSEAAYRADANWGKFFSAAPETYAVTIAEGIEHGTVTADKAEAEEGESVTLTVTPDTGYELSSLTYTVEGAEPVAIENNTFNMPAAAVTINATFTAVNYALSLTECEHGFLAIWGGKSTATMGETVRVAAVGDTGYEATDVKATYVSNGETVEAEMTVDNEGYYTFTMPAAAVTISATFVKKSYPVTVSENIEHGVVTPSADTAQRGDEITVTVEPDECYELTALNYQYDSGSEGWIVRDILDTRSFTMPAAEVVIGATFTAVDYALSLTECEHGFLAIWGGKSTATMGETIRVAAVGDTGYDAVEVKATYVSNGETVEAEMTVDNEGYYTFTMPAAAVTISATFVMKIYSVTVSENIEHGVVTPSADVAPRGAEITVTVEPVEGYELTALNYQYDSGSEGWIVRDILNTRSFTMPAAEVVIGATFEPIPMVLDGVVFANNTYASWYGDTDMALPEGVTAYVVTSVVDDKAQIEAVEYIPAHVGVLLYSATSAESVSARPYTGETATVTSLLQGSVNDMEITDGYGLYGDVFVRILGGTLPAHHCYLPVANAAGAPMRLRIVVRDDVVTAIDEITVSKGAVKYIDVNGRVSDKPFKGINIVIEGNKVTKVVK